MTGNNIYEYLHPSDHDELTALLNQPTASHARLLHGLTLHHLILLLMLLLLLIIIITTTVIF